MKLTHNNNTKFRFEYVKLFEQTTTLIPNTYIVVRVDGRCFHQSVLRWIRSIIPKLRNSFGCIRLSHKYKFEKPNDRRALELMNATATEVMNEFPEIVLGYGMSDEFR